MLEYEVGSAFVLMLCCFNLVRCRDGLCAVGDNHCVRVFLYAIEDDRGGNVRARLHGVHFGRGAPRAIGPVKHAVEDRVFCALVAVRLVRVQWKGQPAKEVKGA